MKLTERLPMFLTGFVRNRTIQVEADSETNMLVFSLMSTRNGGKHWEAEHFIPVPLDNLGAVITALQKIQRRLNLL